MTPDPRLDMEAMLVLGLSRLQESRGWTDIQMARALGASNEIWNKTRRGVRPLGMTVLTGAVKLILSEEGRDLLFLLLDCPDGSKTSPNV